MHGAKIPSTSAYNLMYALHLSHSRRLSQEIINVYDGKAAQGYKLTLTKKIRALPRNWLTKGKIMMHIYFSDIIAVRSFFWTMVKISNLAIYKNRCVSGRLYSVLAVQVRWGLFYGGHLVCSSRPVSLLVQVPHGVCGVQ